MQSPVAIIMSRYYLGTYVARIVGVGVSASSTMSPVRAAEVVCRKHYGDSYECRLVEGGNPAKFEVFRKEVKAS